MSISLETPTLNQSQPELEEFDVQSLLRTAQRAKKQREYAKSMQLLLQAKNKSKDIPNQPLKNRVHLAIGTLYCEVCGYEKAIQHFKNIATDQSSFQHQPTYLTFLVEWGKAYFYTQQYALAQPLFEEAVQLANPISQEKILAVAFAYLGSIATQQEDTQKALRLAQKCNFFIEKIGTDIDGLQVNLINLGRVHFLLGKYSEAIKLTSRGITTAKRLQDEISEIRGFQLMAKIFHQQKSYKNAYLYQSIYSKFYEDFFKKNDRQVLRELELEHTIRTLQRGH